MDIEHAAPTGLYDEWNVIESEFKPEYNGRHESIFALGNGYLGMRGTFEEGHAELEGTYINGFYESVPLKYPEAVYACAQFSQTMLNVTNGKIIRLYLDGEPFSMREGTLLEYERALHLKTGILERNLIWLSPQGRKIRLHIKRLVSFANKHLAAIQYEVTPLNFSGEIRLESVLDGDVKNKMTDNDPRVGSGLQGRVLRIKGRNVKGSYGALTQRTQHTWFVLACAMEHELTSDSLCAVDNAIDKYSVSVIYRLDAQAGQTIKLDKYLGYVGYSSVSATQAPAEARNVIAWGKQQGFGALEAAQQQYLDRFWETADVEIKGNPAIQQSIRFSAFHLIQAVGQDGTTNICAKGLTGEGYEGHYFWDTETFVIPFFLHTHPDISRKLLEYRYHTLGKARIRAKQMSHPKGALFPWRTINGDECSPYFEAGTAQYHINADIAFAIKRYMEATEDNDFLISCGAEILIETARLWADLGRFIKRKGSRFCINEVTGPDEYSALVNNNCYTNLMAKENLLYAYQVACWMKENVPDKYRTLAARISLEAGEVDFWNAAAEAMYVPFDDELQIHLQDDSFLDRAIWDFEHDPIIPGNPLLVRFHPLVIYRYQVCKQADLVLALFMAGHYFTQEQKIRDYDYYESITTHDSSLSPCVFSIVASEIGYRDEACKYFKRTARMDLDDTHKNVEDGLHVANMAGTWMCLVYGFAGMRVYENVLRFNPYVPEGWDEYRFRMTYCRRVIQITVTPTAATYEVLSGESLCILHADKEVMLPPRVAVTVEISDA